MLPTVCGANAHGAQDNEKAPESRAVADDSEALHMVGAEGLEPTTNGLRVRCSAIELGARRSMAEKGNLSQPATLCQTAACGLVRQVMFAKWVGVC